MSSETPAEHLARIKIMFPTWQIWRGKTTGEFWACPPSGPSDQTLITRATLPELETAIADAEARCEP